MIKDSPFVRWWLIFICTVLGSMAAGYFGLLQLVHENDFTKISFLIYALFAGYTVYTGVNTAKASKPLNKKVHKELCSRAEHGWFVADNLLTLGMVGTVFGFIYMLGTSFEGLSAENVQGMQSALGKMGAGMSTALYTTAVGLVCGVLLKVQMFNLSQHLDRTEDGCGCSCKDHA